MILRNTWANGKSFAPPPAHARLEFAEPFRKGEGMSPESSQQSHIEPLSHLEDYFPLVRNGLSEFVRKIVHPVLLVTPLGRSHEQINATVTLDLEGETDVPAKESIGPLAEPLVIPVKTKNGNATNSLWIGRASHCDIILPFEGISRVHAVIRLQEDGDWSSVTFPRATGRCSMAKRWNPGLATLTDDALLMFADIEVTFLSPESFYGELARKLR